MELKVEGEKKLKMGDSKDLGIDQAHGGEGEVWSSDKKGAAT